MSRPNIFNIGSLMLSIFQPRTLQLKTFSFKTSLYTVIIILLILLAAEGVLRIKWVQGWLPAPSIGKEDSYPEIDIKLQRLNTLIQSETVNCFLVGSSMVDAGIDPEILSLTLNDSGQNSYHCFNFGLSGAMVETTATIVDFLSKEYHPEMIILGISPIEFDRTFTTTRNIGEATWIQYKLGNFSFEGWLVEHSYTYRYLLTFINMRQPIFKEDYMFWEQLLTPNGFRSWTNQTLDSTGINEVWLKDFELNPVDLIGLKKIAAFQNQGIKIIIAEMPVHPEFLPYYIEGGEKVYDSHFIQPVLNTFSTQGIPFIRPQPSISSIVPENGWYNKNHLNAEGAKEFSIWLGGKILQSEN